MEKRNPYIQKLIRNIHFRSITAVVLLIVMFMVSVVSPGITTALANGGYYSIDWIAANPYSYNHLTGGGAYDDRTIGLEADVVESLQGGDFACGDIVTYLAQITIDMPPTETDTETIELTTRFSANTTGQPGAGHVDIVNVAVNYGTIEDLIDGENDIDDGINDNGNSTAILIDEYFDPVLAENGGSIFHNPTTSADLVGVILVDNLEAEDTLLVLRVDVRVDCRIPSDPTGNLQGGVSAARVVDPVEDPISIGTQTLPFQNLDQIAYPELNLLKTVSLDPSCPGEFSLNVLAGTRVYYCFEIYNNGNTGLHNVILDDPLFDGDITGVLEGLTDLDGDLEADDLAVAHTASNYANPIPYDVFVKTINTATIDADEVEPDTGSCTVDVYPDFGDLPEEYGLTILADNGARHKIGDLLMGATINDEEDGQENATAEGDDDDGVFLPAGHNWSDGDGELDVNVNGPGCLTAWLDFYNEELEVFEYNYLFTDTYTVTNGGGTQIYDELIIDNELMSTGTNEVKFDLPVGAANGGYFFARFRLVPALPDGESCGEAPGLTGYWENGEVEDYLFIFGPNAVTLAEFDASSKSGVPIWWLAALLLFTIALLGFTITRVFRFNFIGSRQ